ncbi:hypothetical protein pdam_00024389 [Pocillopora damicornis]|uniref:Uncharacterized protein n=1 Tax=Pocillopora damicornis TaxID=46731 RepID=A0A3M6UHS0_POCDA|nr:hypothetical protein pdam_00024389 [Pocillopora damicornis]
MFMLQGFLIFSLHCMRNTQFFERYPSTSARNVFRVARLSADQRAFQKKDEHRFSIFYKEQLHKEELTGQSK